MQSGRLGVMTGWLATGFHGYPLLLRLFFGYTTATKGKRYVM